MESGFQIRYSVLRFICVNACHSYISSSHFPSLQSSISLSYILYCGAPVSLQNAPKTSPKSLSELAPEFVIHIIESLSSFKTPCSWTVPPTTSSIFGVSTPSQLPTAVRPRFKCYQDALELLQIQGRITADGKLVVPEEPCEKDELQFINGLNKLISNRDRDVPAQQAALCLNKAFIPNRLNNQTRLCKQNRRCWLRWKLTTAFPSHNLETYICRITPRRNIRASLSSIVVSGYSLRPRTWKLECCASNQSVWRSWRSWGTQSRGLAC